MKSYPTLMVDLSHQEDSISTTEVFAKDVAAGLSSDPKSLPSRYFYDGNGSKLFQQIMNLPEYYLTRAEFEVLDTHRSKIAASLTEGGFFHLVDLGAGDALKTKILLRELKNQQSFFSYVPVDISKDAMEQLSTSLQMEIPEADVQAVVGEYFEALDWLHSNKPERKVVLFLGSNIGNFEPEDGKSFLRQLRKFLDPGDKLLMGVDLRKDPAIIVPAYDDAAGVTAAFNLNLLHRINRELDGEFDPETFKHYAYYEPQTGAMKSYLVSTRKQDVRIGKTDQDFRFEAWEAIHTENSYKYSLEQIRQYARECGFEQLEIFQDSKQHFADIIFAVV